MSFRDDREAAHRRADALAQELTTACDDIAALKGVRAPRRRRLTVSSGISAARALIGAAIFVVRARNERTTTVRAEAAAAQTDAAGGGLP